MRHKLLRTVLADECTQFMALCRLIKQHRQRRFNHFGHLVGVWVDGRCVGHIATTGEIKKWLGGTYSGVRWPSTSMCSSEIPSSSCVSRNAVAARSASPGSRRPPGNEIWPLWLPNRSVRRVSTKCKALCFGYSNTNTPASRGGWATCGISLGRAGGAMRNCAANPGSGAARRGGCGQQ